MKKAEQIKADLNWVAWRDFVVWAIGDPEMLLRYERATGKKVIGHILTTTAWTQGDLEKEWMHSFVVWVTQTLWGEEDAPPEYHVLASRKFK